jgi:hypothetical protein
LKECAVHLSSLTRLSFEGRWADQLQRKSTPFIDKLDLSKSTPKPCVKVSNACLIAHYCTCQHHHSSVYPCLYTENKNFLLLS